MVAPAVEKEAHFEVVLMSIEPYAAVNDSCSLEAPLEASWKVMHGRADVLVPSYRGTPSASDLISWPAWPASADIFGCCNASFSA